MENITEITCVKVKDSFRINVVLIAKETLRIDAFIIIKPLNRKKYMLLSTVLTHFNIVKSFHVFENFIIKTVYYIHNLP